MVAPPDVGHGHESLLVHRWIPSWLQKLWSHHNMEMRKREEEAVSNDIYLLSIYIYLWVNYNNSLTWDDLAIWGWFPLLTMIPVRFTQIYIYIYSNIFHINTSYSMFYNYMSVPWFPSWNVTSVGNKKTRESESPLQREARVLQRREVCPGRILVPAMTYGITHFYT